MIRHKICRLFLITQIVGFVHFVLACMLAGVRFPVFLQVFVSGQDMALHRQVTVWYWCTAHPGSLIRSLRAISEGALCNSQFRSGGEASSRAESGLQTHSKATDSRLQDSLYQSVRRVYGGTSVIYGVSDGSSKPAPHLGATHATILAQ